MSVKECLINASKAIGFYEIADELENGQAITRQDDYKILCHCLKLVMQEVASEYEPLMRTENIKTIKNKINYSDLSLKAIEIYNVKFNNKNIGFTLYSDYILVPKDGEYTIIYSYLPVNYGLDASLPWGEKRISARTLSYGVVCEYYLLHGQTSDALVWDRRFKDAIVSSCKIFKAKKLPERRWG